MVQKLCGAGVGRSVAAALALALIVIGASLHPARAQDVLPAATGATDATVVLAAGGRRVCSSKGSPTPTSARNLILSSLSFSSALAGYFSSYSLLQFDLSMFPVGTKIESATLTLHQTTAQNGGDWTILVRRLVAPWDENSITYATLPGSITTRHTLTSPQAADIDVSVDLTELISDTINFPLNIANNGILLAGTPQIRPSPAPLPAARAPRRRA